MAETREPHISERRSQRLRPLSDARFDDELVWQLVEAAPDGMVVADRDGRILLVNGRLEEMFGYDRGDLLGKSIEELVPDPLRGRHRAHRTRYAAEPRARAMGEGLELRGRRRDGSELPVEISLSPLDRSDGLLVIVAVRDISERMAREAEMREVRHILDSTADGVCIFDIDTLRFVHVNQGTVDQLGYSREELREMTPLHLCPEFDEHDFRELLRPLVDREHASVTLVTTYRRSDGRDLSVEVVLQCPPSELDQPRRFVALVRDITERLESESRIRDAERRVGVLEDRERIARDLHDTVIQRLFAAGLTVQGLLSVLEAPASEKLQTIVEELDETIAEIRTSIFKLQSHTTTGDGLRGEILRVVREERDPLGFEPRLVFEGPVDTIEDRIGDQILPTLREALSNVARHARASSTDVLVRTDAERVTLEVVDDGIGLPPSRDAPGNGLRNMSVRAEALDGTCDVAASATGGTIVTWQVPRPD